MHRIKSHLGPLTLAAIAASGLIACTDTTTQMSLVGGDGLLCSATAEVGPRGQAVYTGQERDGYTLSGTLLREAADGLSQPVDLTLLRYGAKGAHMVVTDYLNLALGEEEDFRVEGLQQGLWVVSARAASATSASWGRSEPMLLGPDAPAAEVPVRLRSYGADLEVVGIPAALLHEARLTFEWTSTDRIQGDGLEFLDPPERAEYQGPSDSIRDGFQVFDALVHVPEVWLAYDQGAAPPLGPDDEPIFEIQADPFGLSESVRTWMSPCSEGHAAVAMAGPGQLRATLHGVPGLWETHEVTFDLTADEPFGRGVLNVDLEAERSSEIVSFVDASRCK